MDLINFWFTRLILKISDSEENFIFEIKGITKEKNSIEERNAHTSKVKFTPKQWETLE
jgi:GLPGLI family protein